MIKRCVALKSPVLKNVGTDEHSDAGVFAVCIPERDGIVRGPDVL